MIGPPADLLTQRDYFTARHEAAGRALSEGKSREQAT